MEALPLTKALWSYGTQKALQSQGRISHSQHVLAGGCRGWEVAWVSLPIEEGWRNIIAVVADNLGYIRVTGLVLQKHQVLLPFWSKW